MALIECAECEKHVSDKAESCPHCGVPIGKLKTSNERSLSTVKTRNKLAFWVPVLFLCITLVVLPLFGPTWVRSPESSQADDSKDIIEWNMRDWLNERAQEKGLGIKCLSVSLVKESTNKYVGFAEFDNEDQVTVEAITDGKNILYQTTEPLISLR